MGKRPADFPAQDRALALPRERIGGRFVTAYSPELGLEMCEEIANGKTLSTLCRMKEKFPARQTFHRWVINYPELARAYAAARELSAFALEEEALDNARDVRAVPGDSVKVQAYRAAMEQLRWSAARRNPRVFSERGNINLTVPIQINTPLDMGAGAIAGAPDHPNIYQIEAEVVVPVEREQEKHVAERMIEGDKPLVETGIVGRPRKKARKTPEHRSKWTINADTKA